MLVKAVGWGPSPYNSWEKVASVEDQKLFEKTKEIIINMLGLDAVPEEVTRTARFGDDLGADSLDEVELVMAFEEAFDIEISDEDTVNIRNVQDAVDYLKSRNCMVTVATITSD